MSSLCFNADKIYSSRLVIYCIPGGDIFISLLAKRNVTKLLWWYFPRLLCFTVWHLKSTVCVQHEGGVFWVGMITVDGIFLHWSY